MTLHAITVLGHDRPGIIAETTSALADLGLNIEDSTMTLLRGHFAMMLITDGDAGSDELEAALAGLTSDGTLSVAVREVPVDRWTSNPISMSCAITDWICASVARSSITTTMVSPRYYRPGRRSTDRRLHPTWRSPDVPGGELRR